MSCAAWSRRIPGLWTSRSRYQLFAGFSCADEEFFRWTSTSLDFEILSTSKEYQSKIGVDEELPDKIWYRHRWTDDRLENFGADIFRLLTCWKTGADIFGRANSCADIMIRQNLVQTFLA